MDCRLFQAASNGDLQFFEKMTDPNTLLQVTIEKNTVIHVAAQFNQLEAARKIVHLNSRLVYEANPKGNTPLHVAARVGSSSMVQLLIELEKEQVLDIEIGRQHQLLRKVNRDGDTALHVAARNCNFQAVRDLVNEDPELPKYENKAGESALFIAVDRVCYRTAFCILDTAPEYCSYAGRHRMNVLHSIVIRTGDSTAVIVALRQGSGELTCYGNVLDDIRVHVSTFQYFEFNLVSRLCNSVADALTKKASSVVGLQVWLGDLPADIAPLLFLDVH